LQDGMGKAIAAMTHNEAAFVSCGAASGMLLSIAACIAGTDPELADRLPDTQGMRNQVIMRRYDRGTETDAVIRAAGGKIVDVGSKDRPAPPSELLAAINDQTAAIVFVGFESEGRLDPRPIIEPAHQRKVPVLLDGAYALPPKENLWHFTRNTGVDAFITSGGKAIRGPQSTGVVLGKTWIIEGCKYHASPNLRIGRGMKVGKEEFAGIYTALKLFLASDPSEQTAREKEQINLIADRLGGIPGIKLSIIDEMQLRIDLDPAARPTTAEEISEILLKTDPSILLRGRNGRITIRATSLQPGDAQIVADRLHEILSNGSATNRASTK
jgi:seryl-tRNA(Sec) selenium transferase